MLIKQSVLDLLMLEDILRSLNTRGSGESFVVLSQYYYNEAYAYLGEGLAINISYRTCRNLRRLSSCLMDMPVVESLTVKPQLCAPIIPISMPESINALMGVEKDGVAVAGRGENFFNLLNSSLGIGKQHMYTARISIMGTGEIEFGLQENASGHICGCVVSVGDLEAIVQKAAGIVPRKFIINTPFGEIFANEFGFRTGDIPAGWEGSPPLCFNFAEYRNFYGNEAPERIAIENIEYLTCEGKYIFSSFDPS